jgi:hypothetical protein
VEDLNHVPGTPSLDLKLVRVNKDLNWLSYHLKDRNDEPERGVVNGSRKKFYSRIQPMNPISLVHLCKLLLPSSCSH